MKIKHLPFHTAIFHNLCALFTACIISGIIVSHAPAGSYPPAAGQPGSTAVFKDDPSFVAWPSGIEVVRGPMDIANPQNGQASFGSPDLALGKAAGDSFDIVSLGDGGYATLTFNTPIINGPGFDFAVFENGFGDNFLELGFVEVSSDGVNFYRFNSVSLTLTDVQISAYATIDPTDLNNLAGKYRQGYGTPFDLEELAGTPGLNVNDVKYVRIIDVVGSIDDNYATYDSFGNKINDPWPTPFDSSGFDLEAVGVIHSLACAGDFDHDRDIDGRDIAQFGLDLATFELSDFAANFGHTTCND